jgi:hypothetical protein
MTLVVGLYDTLQRAQGAVDDLIDSGFPHGAVSILLSGSTSGEDGSVDGDGGPAMIVSASGRRMALIAAGPLAASLRLRREAGNGNGHVTDTLCAAGLTRFAATYFNEAICDGGVLVAVQCDDVLVRDARDILDTHAPDGFDEWAVPFGERAATRAEPIAHVNGKGQRS